MNKEVQDKVSVISDEAIKAALISLDADLEKRFDVKIAEAKLPPDRRAYYRSRNFAVVAIVVVIVIVVVALLIMGLTSSTAIPPQSVDWRYGFTGVSVLAFAVAGIVGIAAIFKAD